MAVPGGCLAGGAAGIGQVGALQAPGPDCGAILSGMPTGSHRERVIAAIRVSSRPLDDDQIAASTGISPRQTVNQVCRALERAGMVRRRPGPDGKVVNEWLGNLEQEPASTPGQAGTVPRTCAPAGAGRGLW